MTTQKVSVTLEKTAVQRARRTAGPRGLSSYIDAALEEKLERDERRTAFLAYLDELEAADPTPVETKRRGAAASRSDPEGSSRLNDPVVVLDAGVIDRAATDRKFRSTLRHLVGGGWEPVIPTVVLAEAVTGRDQDAPVNQVVRQLGTHDTDEATACRAGHLRFAAQRGWWPPNPEWYRRHRRSPRDRFRSRRRLHH